MKINSKELNKLKLRSSRIKALGEVMNFSLGASSKNIYDSSSKNDTKQILKLKYFLFTDVSWTSLPGVNPEKSIYGNYATNWEYCYKTLNLIDNTRIPARTADGQFLFLADPNIRVALKDDYDFKNVFGTTFGVSYEDWAQKNGDLFYAYV